MKNETKKQLHKWLCITLFGIMFITSFWQSYLEVFHRNETIETILHVIGYLTETPFLVMLVIYLYKYRKLKKENANTTNNIN